MNMRDLARAFLSGDPGKCHNARTDGKVYWLHDSAICRYSNGVYVFDWCDHYTVTTASHMNEILEGYNGGMRVSYSVARDAGIKTFVVR